MFNRKLLENLMDDPNTVDFGKEIIPQAIGNKKVCGYQFEGYWTDIGNIESFFEANIVSLGSNCFLSRKQMLSFSGSRARNFINICL